MLLRVLDGDRGCAFSSTTVSAVREPPVEAAWVMRPSASRWRSSSGRTGAGAAILLLLLTGACGEDGTGEEEVQSRSAAPSASAPEAPGRSATTTSVDAAGPYVLLEAPGWELQEAVDYRAGLGPLDQVEPELDWYAEYIGSRIDHDDSSFTVPTARVSGHTAGVEALRAQLVGFELAPEVIGGRQALVAPPADRNPGIVLVELRPDYAITVLSYDDVVDLRDLAARLVQVDERRWSDAGGQVLDCVPFEPGCEPNG